MKRFFETFFITLLLSVFATAALAQGTIRVVVYGDSLTSGYQLSEGDSYPAKMSKKIQEVGFTNVEVTNMSVAGETTAGGVERLNSLISKQPDIVVVELGGNDIIRGVDPNVIYQNLMHIVGRLKENNVYIVLIGMKAPPNMGDTYAQQVEAVYHRIATFYSTAFYPFALEGIFGNPEMNLADGYHPNGKGTDVMVEQTYALVDAGLRWKWEYMQYQEYYQRQWQKETSGKSGPSVPTPPQGGGSLQFKPEPQPADPSLPSAPQ